MAKNKKPKKGAPSWMVSYCDLQQLLLVFFILLFSTSVTDSAKLQNVLSSFNGSKYMIDGSSTNSLIELNTQSMGDAEQKDDEGDKKYVEKSLSEKKLEVLEKEHDKQALAQNSKDAQLVEESLKDKLGLNDSTKEFDKKIEVSATTDGVLVRFKDGVLFDPGKVDIKGEGNNVLKALGETLDKDQEIRIEGHTDDVSTGNSIYKNNWELSTARAMSVMNQLISNKLITEDRCTISGNSEYKPVAPNDTAENKALNRRVDIIILKN